MSHPLEDPWPPFLDWVRSRDQMVRDRGLVAFWKFLHQLVGAYPPRAYSSLDRQDREDLLSDVYMRCAGGSLLRYARWGRPFSQWLFVVVSHEAINAIRRRRPAEELPEGLVDGSATSDPSRLPDEWDPAVSDCLERAPEHYRRAALWVAFGLKPREAVQLVELPSGMDN